MTSSTSWVESKRPRNRLNVERRREVARRVDVPDHAWIADGHFLQPVLVCLQYALGALVPARSDELLEKNSGDADRVAAPCAPVRRRERRAREERVAHRGDGGGAHERHVGERDEVALDSACRAHCAGEARAHAVGRLLAYHDPAALFLQNRNEIAGSSLHHGEYVLDYGAQVTRGLQRDRHAVRQAMRQLIGAEASRGPRCEQESDDVQPGVLTSQAEGSKRRSGLAAHDGSLTPWRTAVISARIANAISGGVFEPIYRPTGPRRRAISSAERSNSFSLSRRASLFFLEPIAPT